MKYQVIIYYSEPLFQERINSNKTYDVLFEYDLPPGNEEKAKEMALEQFRWNEANRMVRWASRIVRVEVRCEAGQKIAYVQDIVKCEEEPEAPKSPLVNNSEVIARVKERRKTPLDITAQVERKEAASQPFWQTAKIWLLWLCRILWLRGRRSISLLLPYYLKKMGSSLKLKVRVLIVEDDVLIGEILEDAFKETMTEYSFDCFRFQDGDEAFQFIQSANKIDIFITDLNHPGKDGLELVDYMNKNRPETKTVITTGLGSLTKHLQDRNIVLQKPFELHAFIEKIRSLLNQYQKNSKA